MVFSRLLHDNWSFTQVGGGPATKDGEWLDVAAMPTTVHVELQRLGKIPNPFVGLNEWDVQWVGEAKWTFRTNFDASKQELDSHRNVDLIFEGLDTFATVQLNGQEILKSDNQFLFHRVHVKNHLKEGSNELLLVFDSAFLKGRSVEKQHEKLKLWNGDSSRLHVRKAQYNYGWDWGPVLMTTGPWKPIRLEGYKAKLTDVDARVDVLESLDVKVNVAVQLSEQLSAPGTVTIYKPNGQIQHSEPITLFGGKGSVEISFPKGEVELWYPVGYGKQPLYTLEVLIGNEAVAIAAEKQRLAFRRARIVEDKLVDQDGLTFLFEINNIRIFCGGSNWIPADSFLTTISDERYRQWLELLVRGNQNMIRVWGGGIYEADIFYEVCDELGILVWQDFMFGCGQYPAYDSFVESVRLEAEQNVKRLRNHPSVVIFAGNNEDYQIAESEKLQLDYSDETSDFRQTNFPARHIYERVLPEVVHRLSDIHYHRGSPYSGHGKVTTDKTYGDLHQWNVWHGTQEPWHNWDILAGRFVSEFGMEAYPNLRTVDYWLDGNTNERHPQSRTTKNHNKADGYERRLELYLVENFRHAFDMPSYVYYTQVMQAETLASAYRLWRRNWKGRGREYTAGALVWQINDCWPVTSWAIADYFLRPKPAYFAIARELKTYTVGMTRKEYTAYDDELTAVNMKIETIIELWGTNSSLDEKAATLEINSFDLDSDWTDNSSKKISLAPNASTELFKGPLPGQPTRTKLSQVPKNIIVSARLLDEDGSVLARYANWPEPFKFISFPSKEDLGLEVKVEGDRVTLSSLKPVKGIVLDVGGEEVQWSDQAIDLVPNDPQTIEARGLGGRQPTVRYLGDGSA